MALVASYFCYPLYRDIGQICNLSYQKKKSKVALVWFWHIQGFPKKRPFLKIENISNLITDYKKGKIIENIKASFMGNAVSDE